LKLQSRVWVFLFFFVSGTTGLIYEVVWTRFLTLVMGNTLYSVSTVLTVFMGGLALGSYAGGRYIDRHANPLAIYAVLEGAIGIYCLLIPYLIDAAHPLFQSIYLHHSDSYLRASLFRFLVCGAILLVPTTFMGATLPVLSKCVSEDSAFIGRDVGTLYSVNTFGAVVGAFSSGFLLMRVLGLNFTVAFAATLNIGIALVIFFVFLPARRWHTLRQTPVVPEEEIAVQIQSGPVSGVEEGEGGPGKGMVFLVLAVFGFSGMSAMIYQVAWNRILSLLLGSSVYAFSLILTTFILGLAVGTVCFARRVHRFADLVRVFGMLQTGIGVAALLALPVFGKIPFVNRWVYQNLTLDFSAIQGVTFLVIFSLLFVPTFFMGGQFPVVVRLVVRDLKSLGHSVGKVYAVNTIGTIVGSFLAGFVLVTLIGVQKTILFAIGLNVGLGVLLLLVSPTLKPNLKAYGLPLVVILCVYGAQSVAAWDRAVISSGSFMPYRIEDLSQAELKKNKILFYKEGMHTTVTTELSVSGNIFLRVNGKTDASLALDMRTQLLSGYLPMFFHKNPREVLVIGQGSGITLGAVEQFPVEHVDLVEISEAVIEGSRFFSPFNHHALDDPRVRLLLEDGRNHVAMTDKTYDVIISEPSNPWISGVGVLFTRDFYELVRKRLNPGGLVCVWVHTNMSPESFKSILRSFTEVFPQVTMWESIIGDDYLLIGSEEPYALPYEKVTEWLQNEEKGKDLRGIGVRSVGDLMSMFIMDTGKLIQFSSLAPVHTDDNALLEFSAPEYIYKDERAVIVRQLTPYFGFNPGLVRFEFLENGNRQEAIRELAEVKRSESQMKEIKRRARIDQWLDRAQDAVQVGNLNLAIASYDEILKLNPEHVMTYLNLGNVYSALGNYEKAEAEFLRSIELNPHYLFGEVALAKLYLAQHKADRVVQRLENVAARYPGDAEVRFYLGLGYAFQKNSAQAIEELERAIHMDPRLMVAHYYLGVEYQTKNAAQARRHLQIFLDAAEVEINHKGLATRARNLLNKL